MSNRLKNRTSKAATKPIPTKEIISVRDQIIFFIGSYQTYALEKEAIEKNMNGVEKELETLRTKLKTLEGR